MNVWQEQDNGRRGLPDEFGPPAALGLWTAPADQRENREFAAEIKFLVTAHVAEQIRAWARARLLPDPHATGAGGDSYRICSLYFDTVGLDVLSRRGSYGRSKLRIRRYNEEAVAFLERKLRTRRMLAKRRSRVDIVELPRLAEAWARPDWPGYWFHRRLLVRRLVPMCQISYRRTARVALTPHGPVRLTLDEDIRALGASGLEFQEGAGRPVLRDAVILELKFRVVLPALFKHLVEEFMLCPRPLSKYRLAMAALGRGAPAVPDQKTDSATATGRCAVWGEWLRDATTGRFPAGTQARAGDGRGRLT